MKYYVYELINPIDNHVFYVGKGSGNRMYVHEKRAKRSHSELNENKKLRNKIKSILNSGDEIVYKQIFFTDNAIEAYTKESERIQELGLNNLCNRFIFPPTADEIYKIISMRLKGHITSEKTKEKIRNSLIGHEVSEKTRQKISNSQLGKKRPCSELRRLKIAKSRKPKDGYKDVVSPEGVRHSIDVMSIFCKTHGLNAPTMSELMKGKYKSYKGWRILT